MAMAAVLRKRAPLAAGSLIPARRFAARNATVQVQRREPLLFTPGPLTTSAAVKQAMLVDYGSRDGLFIQTVQDVRDGLLRAAGASQKDGFECVIVQGSGTMGVESVLGSVVPRSGKVLIVSNGAYGKRQMDMCRYLSIETNTLEYSDLQAISAGDVLKELRADPKLTHVSVVHHETTAGVLNPLQELAAAIKKEFPAVELIVDSMSGFGAYELRMDWGIDFAVSSANKCIEGVPGFSFALCRRSALEKTKGNGRSLSMDLYAQWLNLEKTGQFRFTPPTHAILAFRQALMEWEAEGGHQGRLARYTANYKTITEGMEQMGFKLYVPEDVRSVLIITYLMPTDPKFDFQKFYDTLAGNGYVIYPGKTAEAESFRFGTIGRLFASDCEMLLAQVRLACSQMNVSLPIKS
jgi:2-aminoethylphosphonate-pyruvate transaminase